MRCPPDIQEETSRARWVHKFALGRWFDLEVLIGESAAGRQEKQERKLSSEDSSIVWKQKIRLRNPNSEFKNREETIQRKQKLATRMQKYRADYK